MRLMPELDGVLMTLIEDGNGKTLLRNTHSGGKLVRQAFGNDQIFSYAYSFSESGPYTESAEVTLADGTRTKVYPSASVPSFTDTLHQNAAIGS
jgi:hypothetical protein